MRVLASILIVSALAGAATCAQAQNVSVNAVITGEVVPGVYGQVVLGNRPPPPVLYQQPMVVQPVMGAPPGEPLYLHVPPGHAKNWRKHCHEYHACNRPVYFVRSAEYEPGFDRARWDREHGHEHHDRGHHDEDRDHDRGDHDHGDHDHGDHERDHNR
jgi:hypothetical protein